MLLRTFCKKRSTVIFNTLLVCNIAGYGHSVIQLVPECKDYTNRKIE